MGDNNLPRRRGDGDEKDEVESDESASEVADGAGVVSETSEEVRGELEEALDDDAGEDGPLTLDEDDEAVDLDADSDDDSDGSDIFETNLDVPLDGESEEGELMREDLAPEENVPTGNVEQEKSPVDIAFDDEEEDVGDGSEQEEQEPSDENFDGFELNLWADVETPDDIVEKAMESLHKNDLATMIFSAIQNSALDQAHCGQWCKEHIESSHSPALIAAIKKLIVSMEGWQNKKTPENAQNFQQAVVDLLKALHGAKKKQASKKPQKQKEDEEEDGEGEPEAEKKKGPDHGSDDHGHKKKDETGAKKPVGNYRKMSKDQAHEAGAKKLKHASSTARLAWEILTGHHEPSKKAAKKPAAKKPAKKAEEHKKADDHGGGHDDHGHDAHEHHDDHGKEEEHH